jgi:hypothetical protein
VAKSEIVLLIRPASSKWNDVIHVELTLVQDEIDWLVTDEALSGLTLQKLLLQRCSTILVKPR